MDKDADKQKLEREAKLERLRADLQKGIDQLDAGEVSKLTMEDIKRLARERFNSRKGDELK